MCKEAIFTAIQHIIPHHLSSRLIGRLAESNNARIKKFLIENAIDIFKIDLSEAALENLDDYPNFNAFFTRELKKGIRPFPQNTHSLASPADGTLSQLGKINHGSLIQAKGIEYGLYELLGGEYQDIQAFKNGHFATLYLSPRDYHRVHLPMSGKHVATTYVPGRLFSVNNATTQRVKGLFTRNERVCQFYETPQGKMAVVFVGAMLVAGIETVKEGLITPPHKSDIQHFKYETSPQSYSIGDEIGRFKFGSTVVLLHENKHFRFSESYTCGDAIKLGQSLGNFTVVTQ